MLPSGNNLKTNHANKMQNAIYRSVDDKIIMMCCKCNWIFELNFFYFFHRELFEESGVIVKRLNKVGLLMFEFIGSKQLMEVHVFQTNEYEGTPVETDGKYQAVIYLLL